LSPARALAGLSRMLARPTATQLTAALAVLAALALTGSLAVTGLAVQADQRQKAALAALQDYAAMAAKLGEDVSFSTQTLTDTDAAWLAAWLEAVQTRPGETRSLEDACATGRGGAAVRLIEAPGVEPAGLVALATADRERLEGLGDGVHLIQLDAGVLCAGRAVDVVAVRQPYGALTLTVGRLVERPGAAWGWAALAVLGTGALILIFGLAAAALARRRLTMAMAGLSQTLDRAAVGDFRNRAPDTSAAPELTDLTRRVNQTLDRLEELMGWLRDASDQLAHDFRTPLARVSTRLDRLSETDDEAERARLTDLARADLDQLTRAMGEALSLRDGAAWVFEQVRLDLLAAQVVELYEPVAAERGLVIQIALEPVEILGVRTLLQRAMTNLVDNAVKYGPEGTAVTVSVAREADQAVFRVRDAGSGFGADPAEGDPAPESHGMGLPFVRAVVRRHGGELTIDDAAPGAVVTARFKS
jgi:signal transduction histidine kinase